MDSPGIYNLGTSVPVTAAVSDSVITSGTSSAGAAQAYIDRLEGMTAVTLFVEFDWGSGGTTFAAIVQTSINQGDDWIDIARFDFTTADRQAVANLSGYLSKAVTTVAVLASEGVNDGVLGDRLRAKVTSTGTYAGNTNVSVRASVR